MVTEYARLKGIYDPLLAKYETAGAARKTCFEAKEAGKDCYATKLPPKPTQPTPLAAYGGLRQARHSTTVANLYTAAEVLSTNTVAVTDSAVGLQANEFVVDGAYGGGWGAWTLGLNTIQEGFGKSFGIWGLAKTTTTPVYDAQTFSY